MARKPVSSSLDFPAVAVPDLPDMDVRHVERPEQGHDDGIRVAREDDQREGEPGPCEAHEQTVGKAEPEERGEIEDRLGAGAEVVLDQRHERRRPA